MLPRLSSKSSLLRKSPNPLIKTEDSAHTGRGRSKLPTRQVIVSLCVAHPDGRLIKFTARLAMSSETLQSRVIVPEWIYYSYAVQMTIIIVGLYTGMCAQMVVETTEIPSSTSILPSSEDC
jgi:hypothetical protein